MDYKQIEILPLYSKAIESRRVGADCLVCLWGTASQEDVFDDATEDAKFSQNLHCMNAELLSHTRCQQTSLSKDFSKLMCGQSVNRHQKITLVIASQNCVYV